MGTRNMIGVVLNGEYKVAQYAQWDGYPEGQGVGVLKFLQNCNLELFKEKVSKCKWVSDEQYHSMWLEVGHDTYNSDGWVDTETSDRFRKIYPQFSRDNGSDILGMVYNSENGLLLQNSSDFPKNSLHCEWAYVIDLDKNTFETYEGCNKNPISKSERFYDNDEVDEYGYYSAKFVIEFQLDDLPTKEEYLSNFKNEDDEEDDTEEIPLF